MWHRLKGIQSGRMCRGFKMKHRISCIYGHESKVQNEHTFRIKHIINIGNVFCRAHKLVVSNVAVVGANQQHKTIRNHKISEAWGLGWVWFGFSVFIICSRKLGKNGALWTAPTPPSYMQSIISIGIFDESLIQKVSLNNAYECRSPLSVCCSLLRPHEYKQMGAFCAHFLFTLCTKTKPNRSELAHSRSRSCFPYHPRYYVDGKTFIFLLLFPLTGCWRVLFSVYISTRLYRIHSIYFSLLFEFHFYLYYVLITFWWFFTFIFFAVSQFRDGILFSFSPVSLSLSFSLLLLFPVIEFVNHCCTPTHWTWIQRNYLFSI